MENFHFTAVVCIVLLALLCRKDAFKADSQITLKINIEPQHLPIKILSILDITNSPFIVSSECFMPSYRSKSHKNLLLNSPLHTLLVEDVYWMEIQ